MRRKILIRTGCILGLISAGLLSSGMEGEPPDWGTPVTWNRTYGGAAYDAAHPVQQTADGGYIVGGASWSFGAGMYDIWLVKIDALGNEQWNRTFGGEAGDEARTLAQTSDGGYILAGVTHSYGFGAGDMWVIKTDENGNEQWNKTLGGTLYDVAHAVHETSDGGFLVAGHTESFGAVTGDAFIVKTDSNGNDEWGGLHGGPENDTLFSARQTSDGDYILAGETLSYGAGSQDFWLLKVDPEGNEIWSKTFGGTEPDGAHCVSETVDGGFILAGGTMSFGEGVFDGWLIKTDAAGNEEWNRTFGGADTDILFYVEQTEDGGYIATGATYSQGAGNGDYWLLKTDADGEEQWSRTFGGDARDESYWLALSDDGGFVMSGRTESFGAGEGDFWVIKTDAEGNAPATPIRNDPM